METETGAFCAAAVPPLLAMRRSLREQRVDGDEVDGRGVAITPAVAVRGFIHREQVVECCRLRQQRIEVEAAVAARRLLAQAAVAELWSSTSQERVEVDGDAVAMRGVP